MFEVSSGITSIGKIVVIGFLVWTIFYGMYKKVGIGLGNTERGRYR